MPLADWQHSLNSLVMGPGTKYGCFIEGLYDDVASPNDLEPLGNGTIARRDRESGKPVIFTYEIVDTPGSAFAATFGAFMTAWKCPVSADTTLQWRVAGITNERKLTGRPRKKAPGKIDYVFTTAGKAVVVCEFFATDPQVYDAVTNAAVDY